MGEITANPRDRHELAARNQSFFRELNERIEELVRGSTATFHEFSCECADTQCVEVVPLMLHEYEHVRRIPTHFIVAPGHVYPDVERVVETDGVGTRYEVVEKFGEAGVLAVALDPRT